MPQLLTKVDIDQRIQLIRDALDEYKDMDISGFSKQRRELFHQTIDNVKRMIEDYITMQKNLEE